MLTRTGHITWARWSASECATLAARMAEDAISLRNRFAMVKGAWDENLRGVAFPSLGEGTAEQKIERLELALVDEMRARATPESAEQVADAMWSLVHNREDGDPVKQRVTRASRGAGAARPPRPAVSRPGPLRQLRAPEARAHRPRLDVLDVPAPPDRAGALPEVPAATRARRAPVTRPCRAPPAPGSSGRPASGWTEARKRLRRVSESTRSASAGAIVVGVGRLRRERAVERDLELARAGRPGGRRPRAAAAPSGLRRRAPRRRSAAAARRPSSRRRGSGTSRARARAPRASAAARASWSACRSATVPFGPRPLRM